MTLAGTAGTPNLTVQSLGAQGGAAFSPGTEFVLVADAAGLVRARPSSEVAGVSTAVLYDQASPQATATYPNYLFSVQYDQSAPFGDAKGALITSRTVGITGAGNTVAGKGLEIVSTLQTATGGGINTNTLSTLGLAAGASTETAGTDNILDAIGIKVTAQTKRLSGTAGANTSTARGILMEVQGDGFTNNTPDAYGLVAGLRGIDLHTMLDYNQGAAIGLNIEMEVTGTPTNELLGARMRGRNIITLLDGRENGYTTGARTAELRLAGASGSGNGGGQIAFYNRDYNSANTVYRMARIASWNYGTDDGGLRFYTASDEVENPVPALTIDNSNYVGVGIADPAAALHVNADNGINNNVLPVLRIDRRSGNTPAVASFGSSIDWYLDNSANTLKNVARLRVLWKDPTAGTDASRMLFETNTYSGGVTTILELDEVGDANFSNNVLINNSLHVGNSVTIDDLLTGKDNATIAGSLRVGGISTTPNATLQVTGDISIHEDAPDGGANLAAGATTIDAKGKSFVRVAANVLGSSISGITAPEGADGHILVIHHDAVAARVLTILNQNIGAANTADRIDTIDGNDIVVTGKAVITLIYSNNDNRWLVMSVRD